jgi:hypothetical protein
MMVYEEDRSKAYQVFVERHGLWNDSRIKALVHPAIQAISATRGRDGTFLRPEMTTVDALRLLVLEELSAPPEEEPQEIDTQMTLFGKPSVDHEGGETDEDLDEDSEDDDEASGEGDGADED